MKEFPTINEYDDETGEEIVHPIVEAIKGGSKLAGPVQIINQFEDDHCPCYEVVIKLDNGVDYKVGLWWMSETGVEAIYRAFYVQEQTDVLYEMLKGE